MDGSRCLPSRPPRRLTEEFFDTWWTIERFDDLEESRDLIRRTNREVKEELSEVVEIPYFLDV